jgi:hypothetical protein
VDLIDNLINKVCIKNKSSLLELVFYSYKDNNNNFKDNNKNKK